MFKLWLENSSLKSLAKKIKIDISKYDLKQIKMGMKVEKEHGSRFKKLNVTKDSELATFKIVLAHLNEKPNYYSLLKKVEN